MTTVIRRDPEVGAGGGADSGPGVSGHGGGSGSTDTQLDDAAARRSWRLSVGSITVLAAALSIVTLGRPSLSLDESVSASLAGAPWSLFRHTVLHRESNMALYYLLLKLWHGAPSDVLRHLAGPEAVLRLPSVAAAVGAVAVVTVLTRRLFDRRTAVVAGLLLAVDPLVVMFAQDARGYALSLLLVSASSALFVRGIRSSGGAGLWWGYVILSALAAYVNFWAALVPLAHAASLAFLPPGAIPWRRLGSAAAGLFVALVPLALLIHATDSSGVNWAAGSSAGRVISTVRADIPHPLLDLAAVLVVVIVVAAVALARRRPRFTVTPEAWPVAFALCWLVVPIAAVVLLSLTYKPLLVLRYLVVCLPPLLMLAAFAVTRLRRRHLAAGAAVGVALVVASVGGTGALFAHGSPQDWRGAVAAVAAGSEPNDGVIVFAPYTRIPFQYYVDQEQADGMPAAAANLQPVFPGGGWQGTALVYDRSLPLSGPALRRDLGDLQRVWLVQSQQALYPAEEQALLSTLRSAGFVAGPLRVFHGVDVVLYLAPPSRR